MLQSPDLRPAIPPQQPQETGLVPTRLITSAESVLMAGDVPIITGPAGAINPTGVAPVQSRTEQHSGEIVEGEEPALDETFEFNRGLYLPTTDLAPWAGRNEQPKVTWEPGDRIGDKVGAWIDPQKDDVGLIMAAWPQRVMRRLEAMRRRGMLPLCLEVRDTEMEEMHRAADTTLALTRKAVIEALNATDEHGILPFARQAGAAVVNDAVANPQVTDAETRAPTDNAELTAPELAAVEAAVNGDTLSPEAFAALLAEPSTPASPASHSTGENTRAISWVGQGGDGAASSWMMPQREPAANLSEPETTHDGYVSVMADVEIPAAVREAFGEQKPMSAAEFDERMTQLNAERNFLEKALADGEIAPEDLGSAKARLTLIMQKESELLAKGTGGENGASNSLKTMERVLSALRKI